MYWIERKAREGFETTNVLKMERVKGNVKLKWLWIYKIPDLLKQSQITFNLWSECKLDFTFERIIYVRRTLQLKA